MGSRWSPPAPKMWSNCGEWVSTKTLSWASSGHSAAAVRMLLILNEMWLSSIVIMKGRWYQTAIAFHLLISSPCLCSSQLRVCAGTLPGGPPSGGASADPSPSGVLWPSSFAGPHRPRGRWDLSAAESRPTFLKNCLSAQWFCSIYPLLSGTC